MAFTKALLLILILSNSLVMARTKLLEFSTRQNVHNLKLDSLTGVTFYLKGKNTLAYSAKNRANVVIEKKSNSEFDVIKVNDDLYIISVKDNHFKNFSFFQDSEIYFYNIKSNELNFISKGSYPKFHKKSGYISFTKEDKDKLFIEVINTRNYLDRFQIPLKTRDLLYRPQTIIFDDSLIYFTDRNKDFYEYVSIYNNRSKKQFLLHEFDTTNSKLSLTSDNEKIYILETAISNKSYVQLSSLEKGSIDYTKKTPLFNTTYGPAYNLQYNSGELNFILTLKSKNSNLINQRELVSFDLKEKKLFKRTDLNYVSTYTIQNEKVLIPYKDKIYLLTNKEGKYSINEEIKSQL
ncbi:hypothetical protein [Halobacteriovorax sp. YZS-1-1]|uniref:hypothetical protein n=1 Tax=unclassified Halobacteriovorax TaxID=2639665 RepID=UPI00399AC63B